MEHQNFLKLQAKHPKSYPDASKAESPPSAKANANPALPHLVSTAPIAVLEE
jgi:hypothetical protein